MTEYNKSLLDDMFKNLKPLETKPSADRIIIIVDRSGSMSSIREDAEGGVNEFIKEQQKIGEATLTIVEFDNTIDLVCEQVNIKTASPYTLQPRGMTALYDAVGVTLANAEYIDTTGKVIVVIVTDGLENASKEYRLDQILERITELKDKGWEFLFLAADQDAMVTGGAMGISPGSTVTFDKSGIGTQTAYAAASVYTTSLRSGKSVADAESALKAVADASEFLTVGQIDLDLTDSDDINS